MSWCSETARLTAVKVKSLEAPIMMPTIFTYPIHTNGPFSLRLLFCCLVCMEALTAAAILASQVMRR